MNSPINAFDLIVLAVLVAGLLTGRRRGMSEELVGLLKWLVLVVGCALLYQPLGSAFAGSSSVFSLLSCYLMAYITAGMVIHGLFILFKKLVGGKLLGSDFFGAAEYYLGMGSGLVRFTCILLVGMALLNARGYDANEVRAMQNFQQREFGSVSFPTLHTIQTTVFDESLTGPLVRDHLGFLLIQRTKPENKEFRQREYTMPE